jgi:hypothetical protein
MCKTANAARASKRAPKLPFVTASGGPPDLLVHAGYTDRTHVGLRCRSQQVLLKGDRARLVHSGDHIRIDHHRHHEPLEQRVTEDQWLECEWSL